ncbi:hypothetical protein BEL04_18175 [Mucilaginibacter sp. PPCGB 2223]|uniref:hypothetical protein n=1 Tax=Mucilaginibacter sp. PPCGB 2223 TaxID=1886027 RepID=UPI000825A582|nr:hypothetical protein [Mucilaginibacter sp. PPCGB 2223]OCX51929.1 hypothetical protein BEL04_18175 [Mucilaginibacter sp. PPCGB 2223]
MPNKSKKEMMEAAKEYVDRLNKEGRLKVTYTSQTVYSCILKDGELEIEDNTDKFTNLPGILFGQAIKK